MFSRLFLAWLLFIESYFCIVSFSRVTFHTTWDIWEHREIEKNVSWFDERKIWVLEVSPVKYGSGSFVRKVPHFLVQEKCDSRKFEGKCNFGHTTSIEWAQDLQLTSNRLKIFSRLNSWPNQC